MAALQNLKGFVLRGNTHLLLIREDEKRRQTMANNQQLTIAQAKQTDMVGYFHRLGFRPAKIRGYDHWYLSPLHEENTPSFKINSRLNRWFDFGLGKGGNMVDFGVLFHGCSVKDFLVRLGGDFSFQQIQPLIAGVGGLVRVAEPQQRITIQSEKELTSPALMSYLSQRKIAADIARNYCRQITYSYNKRTYYAIGFKNDSGGFEIRSKNAKLSSSPKGITCLKNGGEKLAVFEGFMDFLSYRSMLPERQATDCDYLILNSTSFLEKSMPLMNDYNEKLLFLDHDPTGRKFTSQLLELKSGYRNQSSLYTGFKDLNEWLVNGGSKDDLKKTKSMREGRGL